jgi:hypothetical protein
VASFLEQDKDPAEGIVLVDPPIMNAVHDSAALVNDD